MVKRFISALAGIACAVMLMTGGSMVSMAEETRPVLEPGRYFGTVTEETEDSILLNTPTQGDIVLHISDTTKILDAVEGMPITLDSIEVGDSIYAYTSPVMTLSLPPQTHAIMILADIPADFKVPALERVETLVKESEGNYVVETVSGEEYTINPETVMLPFLTRNMVFPESLQKGTQFLVWTTATQPDTAYKIMVFLPGQLGENGGTSNQPSVPASPGQALNQSNQQNQTNQNTPQNQPSQPVQINQSEWIAENGVWYFLKDGVRQKGWLFTDDNWYYLDPATGAMQTGFVMVDGNVYYLLEDGRMLTEAKTFIPDESGALH